MLQESLTEMDQGRGVEERGAQRVADGVAPADMVAQAVNGLPVGHAFPELQHG